MVCLSALVSKKEYGCRPVLGGQMVVKHVNRRHIFEGRTSG